MESPAMLDPFDVMLPAAVRWLEPTTLEFAQTVLDATALPAGSRILDVGAGTGPLVVAASQRGHRVTGIDSAPLTTTYLTGRLAEYPNSDAQLMDAADLTFPDGSFDAAFSVLAVMFTRPAATALAQMRRVVRPGGTVAIVHWAASYASPYIKILLDALQELEGGAPIAMGMEFVDPDEFAAALSAAGFVDVQVKPITADYAWPAAEEIFAEFQPFYVKFPPVQALSPARRADLEILLVERVRRIETGQDPWPVLEANVAYAQVPQDRIA
jgi:SAM-dependent methyltransferase